MFKNHSSRIMVLLALCLLGPAGQQALAAEPTAPASAPIRNVVLVHGAYADGSCHSWAGTVISETGTDPKVAARVYVAARAPEAGEDYVALAAKFPKPPASAGLVKAGGFAQLSEEAFLRDFAGDIDPAKARVLYAVQGRISETLFASRTTQAAWHSKPTWYAVSTKDRTTAPELQRFVARRMNAKTVEVESSHLSFLSHPDDITRLILEAAGHPNK